ncbi:MAG: hypothetical protein B6D61_03090 [Bacteroidetes bacterium 4484_249]|nr:MAG: hypothetical protein B6D61_03090 [Bacteroidetes bacterium 4484_249]
MPERKYNNALILLIGISAVIRTFLAWSLELGNDEVYYWTYALYPDLSHFDHPPMVGFVIQLFSFNLFFENEVFLRMGSVVFGSVNIWMVYLIGKKIKDPATGFYAALLYTSSIYGFFITGVFILPDTPQMLFWFISLYFITDSLLRPEFDNVSRRNFIWVGVFIGFAMLSKYTSVFIWFGIVLYILIFDRKWLKTKSLYISLIITLIIFSPVIWWNFQNDFISITFQSERVDIFASSLRIDYFIMEVLGEFLYNNPVNYILIILSLIAVYKKKSFVSNRNLRLLLLIGLPLIFVFILFSLFRRTLPHWPAPGYSTLIFVASAYISNKYADKKSNKIIPSEIKAALYLLAFVIIIGFIQVNFGIIRFDNPKTTEATELGESDISLDIYGWKQIGEGFTKILQRDVKERKIKPNPVMITYRWFPAANLDYYVASPNNIDVLAAGPIGDIHKYYWINKKRAGFYLGMDAYYITTSRDYVNPKQVFTRYFNKTEPADTIRIVRGGKHVMNAFVYRLTDMKRLPKY